MRISGTARSRVIAASIVVVVLVAGLVGWTATRTPTGTTPVAPRALVAAAPGSVSVVGAVSALAVLHEWDLARGEAWAAGDAAALRRLYVPGARVGRRDVRMLQGWLDRGLRVRDLAMQVVAVELRRREPDRIVMVVTDRLATATAVPVETAGPGAAGAAPVDLPRDEATTRRLVFTRVGDAWRMASASEVALGTGPG